jgi:rhodanese-related sulfurtransferase
LTGSDDSLTVSVAAKSTVQPEVTMKRLLVFVALFGAAPALAQEPEPLQLGDFAHAIGPGKTLGVPPGLYAQIAQRADAFLSGTSPTPHRALYADEVMAMVDRAANGGPRVFILDIRTAAKVAAGHIAGSVNVPFETVARPENLAKLPEDGTPIVVVCNTGHTASQVNSILAILGYNAWTLRFGWLGWAASTPTPFGSATGAKSVVTGAGLPVVK